MGVWLGMMQVFLAAGSHPLLTWRSRAGATAPNPPRVSVGRSARLSRAEALARVARALTGDRPAPLPGLTAKRLVAGLSWQSFVCLAR